jgi:hypothetical protein
MRGNWNKVNGAIREALTSVSLADMMAFPPAFGVPLEVSGGGLAKEEAAPRGAVKQ